MILYNPFKPHIVEFEDGTFGVRRLTINGYAFLDMEFGYSWVYLEPNIIQYCKTDFEQANKLFIQVTKSKPLKAKKYEIL